MPGRFPPPVVQPCAADGVGHGLGDGGVAAQRCGVGEQGVGAVEQPEFALLVRGDVGDEPGARLVPCRSSGRELAVEHPFAERLGDDRGGVGPAAGGDVLGRGPRGDPVDHGGDVGGVRGGGPPGRSSEFVCQVGECPGGRRAVARQVVAGDDRDRPSPGAAPRGQSGQEPGRRGADGGFGVAVQGFDVGADLRQGGVQPTRAGAGVTRLGHRQRDHGEFGSPPVAQPRRVIASRVRHRKRVDHLAAVAFGRPRHQGVETVLGRQPRGKVGAAPGEGGDAPVGGDHRDGGPPPAGCAEWPNTHEINPLPCDLTHEKGEGMGSRLFPQPFSRRFFGDDSWMSEKRLRQGDG